MNKRFLLIGLFATAIMANNYVLSMEKDKFRPEDQCIPGASYYIFEYNGKYSDSSSMYGSTKYATFYTFDGTEIATVDAETKIARLVDGTKIATVERFDFDPLKALLDPKAPKPQPTSCLIIYGSGVSMITGFREGAPNCLINFLDKNNKCVASHSFNREKHEITREDYHYDKTRDEHHYDYETFPFDETNLQSIRTDKREFYLEKLHLDLSKLSEVRIEEVKYTIPWLDWVQRHLFLK